MDLLGGSERMAFEVAKGLAREGWEIYLGYERDGIWRERYAPFTKSFHPIRLPVLTFRRPGELIAACVRLYRLMRRLGIRCLFTSYNGHLLVAALLEKFCGVRSCFHLGLMGSVANTVSGRWAIRYISAGVAPSEKTAQSWGKIGWPQSTLHQAPNWIDWEDYRKLPNREEARKMLGIGEMEDGRWKMGGFGGQDLKVVSYVGRLVPEKGIEVLLEAWRAVAEKVPEAVLLLAGEGISEYEAKLRAKAGQHVIFLGKVKDPKKVYVASDLVVVPSLWDEPFGLVPLEAVACGALPLVSDRGFLPGLVEGVDAHLIHPAGEDGILARRIMTYLSTSNENIVHQLQSAMQKRFSPLHGVRAYKDTLSPPEA